MIEKTILNHLAATMNMTDVYMEVPENPPATFIVIEKTGGGENNEIGAATFAIQSYGPSLLDAATLNVSVKTAMKSLITHSDVAKCQLDTDYNFTDTSTKRYRYQAVYDITCYE